MTERANVYSTHLAEAFIQEHNPADSSKRCTLMADIFMAWAALHSASSNGIPAEQHVFGLTYW